MAMRIASRVVLEKKKKCITLTSYQLFFLDLQRIHTFTGAFGISRIVYKCMFHSLLFIRAKIP